MSRLRVTVLTPTLNAARHLPDCLASLAQQSYPRDLVEHLVLDGGSSDRTVELVAESSPWSTVVREHDNSPYEALNKGLARARGDLIAWLNADDVYYPNALADAANALAQQPDAEIAVANWVARHPNGWEQRETAHVDALQRVRNARLDGYWVNPLATFFRTKTLRDLGGYAEDFRISADHDLWIRAASRTDVPLLVHTNSCVGQYRMHAEALSSGTKAWLEGVKMCRKWMHDESAPEGIRRFVRRGYVFTQLQLALRGYPDSPLGHRLRLRANALLGVREAGFSGVFDFMAAAARLPAAREGS